MIGWARDEGNGFAGSAPGQTVNQTRKLSSEEFDLWAQLKWDLSFDEVSNLKRLYGANNSARTHTIAPLEPPFYSTICCSGQTGQLQAVCTNCSGSWWAFGRATTDQSMSCAARRAARRWTQDVENPPVYVFSFDHAPTGDWNSGCIQGDALLNLTISPGTNISNNTCAPHRNPLRNNFAYHANDIPYWFMALPILDTNCSAFEGEVIDDCPASRRDWQAVLLARQMASLWVSFARDGMPRLPSSHEHTTKQHLGNGTWPRWDQNHQRVLHLATLREGGLAAHQREKESECGFWDDWEAL